MTDAATGVVLGQTEVTHLLGVKDVVCELAERATLTPSVADPKATDAVDASGRR